MDIRRLEPKGSCHPLTASGGHVCTLEADKLWVLGREKRLKHLKDLGEATLAKEVEEQVAVLQHLLPTETAALLFTPALQLPANPTARYIKSLRF